jgi:TolB-like protein/DNA-binding winged helix-turn-helix (wHTH) protein/Tfp pilus assembly protein PilF
MPDKTRCFYDFGAFRLDPVEHVLLRAGARVPLTPKAFETLLALVENAGHILEKDDLLKRAWPDTFVEEGTLARNISTLRKALGDDAEGKTYIETIPRRGYCFVVPVKQVPEEGIGTSSAMRTEPHATTHSEPQNFLSPHWLVAALALAILLAAAYALWQSSSYLRRDSPRRITLAVLPFENLSGEPAQQFFADGFSEELITQLGGLEPTSLGIIGRTSAMQYQGTTKDSRQIGRELGAEYVLTGSVRRDKDRVRITARLIRAHDGTTLWAKDYDRNVSDILALQNEVASAIAREISLKLSPEENARLVAARPVDPVAYESYLKGRYFWNKRTSSSYVKAIQYFNEAIARDAKYAQAYTGLADAYALLGSLANAELPRREAMPKARTAALAALQLDDSLAEAHTSLAFEEMHYEWDWPAAEREFKRALQLNPNYATAHQWYALWFVARGTPEQALAQLNLAEKADPLSIIIKVDTSYVLTGAGRYEQAAQVAVRALELDPNFALAHFALAEAYAGQQLYPQAISELQKMLATDNGNTWGHAAMARDYAQMGQTAEAERLLQEMLAGCGNRGGCPFDIASIYSSLGEQDRAFAWLEKAYQDRDGGLILLKGSFPLIRLRSDARYADLSTRVGLSPVRSDETERLR